MKKIILRDGACIGCGACIAVDPENFDFNDDGFAIIKNESATGEETNSLLNAVTSCPTNAIIIEDSANDDDNNCPEGCTCKPVCECGDNCDCNENKNIEE